MTRLVSTASVRNSGGKSVALWCYQCECQNELCYVVKLRKSMSKFKKTGKRITCPVHESPIATSQWAQKFYKLVASHKAHSIQGIVWDWYDVPGNHHMHIDATVFAGDSCFRFEIDGETHFDSSGTQRSEIDIDKDAILRAHGVNLLRLHYRDVNEWPKYVQHFLSAGGAKSKGTVMYTGSYRQCLDCHEAVHVLDV